jgi:two-component system NtrC family sensor kinase
MLKSVRHDAAFYGGMWATIQAGRPWRGELVNQRKDGTWYDEEMTITPVRDGAGLVSHYIAVKSDISGRKRAEQQLRESEALYRSVMDNLAHCVFRKDREGRFVYVNQQFCRSLGREESAVLGRTDAELFPAKLADKFRADDQRVLETGEPLLMLEEYPTPGGRKRIVEVSKFVVRDGAGAAVAVQGIFWDITDRVEAERDKSRMEIQLRHAQKMESIGQLAAGIAHEINTPIQYVGDNLRFLADAFQGLRSAFDQSRRLLDAVKQGGGSPELATEASAAFEQLDLDYLLREIPTALEQSLHGVGRVASIVRAMKEFSHPGSEDKAPTDLNHAIENTVAVARNEWKYVAEVETHFDPELPRVPCIVGEFNQVILNLVVNAAHAIGDAVAERPGTKGRITLATRRVGTEVEISVQDTGLGIPERIRDRVFDPFFTTKPVGKGTGQGLAIVHSVVVDKHGGSIRFETEAGQGTTFYVRLPLQVANPAA